MKMYPVRKVKAEKADKTVINEEVKVLLALKAEYKQAAGKDWTPGATVKVTVPQVEQTNASVDANDVLQKITAQNTKIKELKAKVDAESKLLAALQADYKGLTGKQWNPSATPAAPNTPVKQLGSTGEENTLLQKIASQGDKIRDLKTKKADKAAIDAEVKILLSLKTDYQTLTGKVWKPGTVAAVPKAESQAAPISSGGGDSVKEELIAKVTDQGNLVRDLKTKKASKVDIDSAVKVLLDLKAEYKTVTGTEFPVPGKTPSKAKENKTPAAPKEKVAKQKSAAKEKKPTEANDAGGLKKQTRLGLEAKKEENLADWYSQVITKGEMIEYYDVSGCYIFRPWSFEVWEAVRNWFDAEIKKLGVRNCYFPIFVSRAVLEKEKTHIADFSPEVAWVTKSGDSDMAEPIAIRPTSETVMYPAYAKWIQSYRDLPIKLNQWNNVVRWEFKHPQPFLRTREFLWQEGHTAYASKEEAVAEVATILDLYARIYTDLLAIPVVKGRKTEKEKFAGGDYTLTVEAFISASGRAIQGATSHYLGQNFSKIFDIIYEDPETQEKKYIYQNSWGVTTRTIGVMIMVHADNQGLVLPPRVACIQVVIVPCGITVGLSEEVRNVLQASCDALEKRINKWWSQSRRRLPFKLFARLEVQPLGTQVRRDTGEKIVLSRANIAQKIRELLDEIQNGLFKRACQDLESHKILLTDWSLFSPNLDKKNIILAPFCGDSDCEGKIKADSTREEEDLSRDDDAEPGAPSMGAKSLCIPFEQPAEIKPTDKCIHPECKRKPLFYTLFGRSY
ncbi:hypothetical protein NQ317_011422 [Molorchus minor]|uniref:proline--tRNA ligase n=1 Tax=Molorchus minor TaxID=1323400 RepID=A0ABQ9JR59_9CUCU|nr:hypothetical protein NQ317_011422 [Molorchus minor]